MKPNEVYAVFQSFKALINDPAMKDIDKGEIGREFKNSLPPLAYTPHAKSTIAAVVAAIDAEIENGRAERRETKEKAAVQGTTRTGKEAQENVPESGEEQGGGVRRKKVATRKP
jgi:hypothetical protein